MELIGSLFLILALALLVAIFVARPFLRPEFHPDTAEKMAVEQEDDHRRSSLLAERDRVLTALQELEFDYVLGKVPEEDYPEQRAIMLYHGAAILRQLDEVQPGEQAGAGSVEERFEAAVAARRADASIGGAGTATAVAVVESNGSKKPVGKDPLEELIASRKRQREEKSAGFCPGCGKPAQKSDRFCSRCGTTL
jgi:hypothetical protein